MSNTIIILGTVLVVLIVYMLFQSYFDGEQKLLSQAYLKDADDIPKDKISKPNASNFSYGIWIYVQQWQEPTAVTAADAAATGGAEVSLEGASRIFTRQDELGLYLGANATLKVRLADVGKDVKASSATTSTGTGDVTNYSEITLTKNFPIQKWVHVGLVVDGNKFDGYIDGKMVKSVGLESTGITPALDATTGTAENKIEFGKNNTMKKTLMIAEHKRRTYPMDPKGMWDLYMKGNGANGLTQAASNMNVNLSILKDGVESSTFSLW